MCVCERERVSLLQSNRRASHEQSNTFNSLLLLVDVKAITIQISPTTM